jgi:formate/nitrite transporter FocA (FNT family)
LTMSPAIISMIVTGLLCLIFVILAVRSFIAARSQT